MTTNSDGRYARNRTSFGGLLLLVLGAALAPGPCAASDAADRDPRIQAALASHGDPARGGAEFARLCARCHGASAGGNAGQGIPVLAGQEAAYVVRQLAGFAAEQRESVAMHRVLSARELQQPQLWADLAAYLGAAPVPPTAHTGNGQHLGLGEATYRIQCASCHHADGRGDEDGSIPSLRNQNYRYLLRQVKRLAEFHRHNLDENVALLLRSLHEDEARGLADYMSRFRGPPPAGTE